MLAHVVEGDHVAVGHNDEEREDHDLAVKLHKLRVLLVQELVPLVIMRVFFHGPHRAATESVFPNYLGAIQGAVLYEVFYCLLFVFVIDLLFFTFIDAPDDEF